MDHQLSLFVRKYCFDFAKASKALRSYVQHVRPSPPHSAPQQALRVPWRGLAVLRSRNVL